VGRRSYYKTQYNRPNRKWVCGRTRIGLPCPKGPTVHGACPGRYECDPAEVNGRWKCTRPDNYGGPCDSPGLADPSFGPLADVKTGKAVCCRPTGCSPDRSLRSKRGLITALAVATCLAALLMAVGHPRYRNATISPGLLTKHHQGASAGIVIPSGSSNRTSFRSPVTAKQSGRSDLVHRVSSNRWNPATDSNNRAC